MSFFQIKVMPFLVTTLLFLFRLGKRSLQVKIKCLLETAENPAHSFAECLGFLENITQSLNTSGIVSIGYFSAERKMSYFLNPAATLGQLSMSRKETYT